MMARVINWYRLIWHSKRNSCFGEAVNSYLLYLREYKEIAINLPSPVQEHYLLNEKRVIIRFVSIKTNLTFVS